MTLPKQDILDKIEALNGKQVDENWLRYNLDLIKEIYAKQKELKIFITKSGLQTTIKEPLEDILFNDFPKALVLRTKDTETKVDFEKAKFEVVKGIWAEYSFRIYEKVSDKRFNLPARIDLVYHTED